jgi:hypothetical protein
MKRRVIEEIKKTTGAEVVNKDFLLGDIHRMTFEQDVDYIDIAEAAAKVDAKIGSEVSVWAIGMSIHGRPQVAYQRFNSADASDMRENTEQESRLPDTGDDGTPDKGYISMEK